jgi:hypothetical protein
LTGEQKIPRRRQYFREGEKEGLNSNDPSGREQDQVAFNLKNLPQSGSKRKIIFWQSFIVTV